MRCPYCGHMNVQGFAHCSACHQEFEQVSDEQAEKPALQASIETDTVMALCPSEPVSVAPTTPLRDVVKLLAERNIGCVLVTFCDTLMGIFTERDLILRVGTRYAEAADEPIRHFMTPAPETLSSDDSVALALNRMAVGDFRHLPIEDNERVVGVTSVRDVLEYLAQQFPEVLGNMN